MCVLGVGPDMELTVLQFFRSVRTGELSQFVHCLLQLLPWCFALDHVKARWQSVYVRDLIMLERHTPTFSAIWAGDFVLRKIKRIFSSTVLKKAMSNAALL
ncbi:hypothetical protein PoB_005811200 [Plakobranchus ocellatus]|uniref:Uncharacterized protein n=1 Tax=Plakobranchus ocellatus TaxID=259542 RepID=A0AAV4CJM9_9GAST|nr:hypothetical protein PoB_005811200 [Plakobranchus ocellatus]